MTLILTQNEDVTLPYSLCASFRADTAIELEKNDAPEQATGLAVNQPLRGALNVDGDVDYYAFELESAGAVKIRFTHDYFDDSSTYYQLGLFRNVGDDYLWRAEASGQNSSLESRTFFLDAGSYFIRTEKYYYTDVPYTLEIVWEADENVEREENDSFEKATEFSVNTPVRGAFTSDDDVDFYRFTLEEPGEVILKHSHEYFDNGDTFYKYALYNDTRSDALLFENSCTGRDSGFVRDAVYLPAGTYYLQAGSYYRSDRPYTVEIGFTPLADAEQERNDSYTEATQIAVNREYAGALMNDSDLDFYTFTLEELSEVRIGFDFTYFDDGDTFFNIALDTDARNDSTYFRTSLSGRDNGYSSNPFYLAAGTYYLRLESSYHTGRPYKLQIKAEACTDAEEEWNNTYETASPIGIRQDMKGAIRYDGDQDCYVFTLQQAGMARIHFRHDWFDDGGTFYQIFLDAQPNNSDRRLELGITGQDSDVYSDLVELQPGTYYLTVAGYYYNSTPYMISVE